MIKLNKDFMLGAALGFGAGFFTASSGIFKNGNYKATIKSAIKAGLAGFEHMRETAARGAETLEDLFFEARTEMSAEQAKEAVRAETAVAREYGEIESEQASGEEAAIADEADAHLAHTLAQASAAHPAQTASAKAKKSKTH